MTLHDILLCCRKNRIIPHILFWLFSISVFTGILFYTRDFRISEIDLKTAVNFTITICLLALSVYISLLWLIPAFFKKQKYFLFCVFEVGNIFLFIILNYFISILFEGGEHLNIMTEMVAEFILVSVFLLISALLQFTRDSLALQNVELKMKEVERQKMEAELRALKSQINPHFFFNTLNSLYSLSLDRSEKAPELILKLSELMRYVIYDSREDMLPLERQLDFIRSYIYLEELRAGPTLNVEFVVMGDPGEIMIAPLLFIPFIENAFKHVVRYKDRKPDVYVLFDLRQPGRILFRNENNKEKQNSKDREGIGLINVRKSLEFLFPGKYQLDIIDSEQLFKVNLIIDIS